MLRSLSFLSFVLMTDHKLTLKVHNTKMFHLKGSSNLTSA